MSEREPTQEPNQFEVSPVDHDQIMCFFALDMAEKMGDNLRYIFTPEEYPELEYESVDVSMNDEAYTVEYVYCADEEAEGPDTFTFTYYPQKRQLFLRETLNLQSMQKLDQEAEEYGQHKVVAYLGMIAGLRQRAKKDTIIAATLNKYDAVKTTIATGRNAVRNGTMNQAEKQDRTDELNQMQIENERMLQFFFDAVAYKDESFAKQLKSYEELSEAKRKADELTDQLDEDATPKVADAYYFITTLKVLAALEKSTEA